ncbi:MAG: hypothetical protein JW900_05450 [Anaerolineae bacterium]|nr:hypothetical protein [Anaerolineae bacterium]
MSERLTADDMARLRRIRRITGLGINLAGVEVILHMRQRIRRLEAELEQLHRRGLAFLQEPPDHWKLLGCDEQVEKKG